MNNTAIGDLVRSLVASLGTLAVAKGYGDADLWVAFGGGAAIVVSGLWTYFAHKWSSAK